MRQKNVRAFSGMLALSGQRLIEKIVVLQLCATTRRSMSAARRTVPLPTDFETAMRVLNLPWAFDQLNPYVTDPVRNPPLLPTPPPDDVFHKDTGLPTSFLGPGLSGDEDRKKTTYIPTHLPPFPSRHTYKATAVYSPREADPRRIRELATEEGKLGEEALRKLAGAVKIETVSELLEVAERPQSDWGGTRVSREQTIEKAFEDTMRELMTNETSSNGSTFEIGPIVNCEKKFMLQDIVPTHRRPPDTDASRSAVGLGRTDHLGQQPASAVSQGKQKAKHASVDAMQL